MEILIRREEIKHLKADLSIVEETIGCCGGLERLALTEVSFEIKNRLLKKKIELRRAERVLLN